MRHSPIELFEPIYTNATIEQRFIRAVISACTKVPMLVLSLLRLLVQQNRQWMPGGKTCGPAESDQQSRWYVGYQLQYFEYMLPNKTIVMGDNRGGGALKKHLLSMMRCLTKLIRIVAKPA